MLNGRYRDPKTMARKARLLGRLNEKSISACYPGPEHLRGSLSDSRVARCMWICSLDPLHRRIRYTPLGTEAGQFHQVPKLPHQLGLTRFYYLQTIFACVSVIRFVGIEVSILSFLLSCGINRLENWAGWADQSSATHSM